MHVYKKGPFQQHNLLKPPYQIEWSQFANKHILKYTDLVDFSAVLKWARVADVIHQANNITSHISLRKELKVWQHLMQLREKEPLISTGQTWRLPYISVKKHKNFDLRADISLVHKHKLC